MHFFAQPYETLFAWKVEVFAALLGLTFAGLALNLATRRDRNPRETLCNLVIFAGNNTVNLFFAQAIQLAALGWLHRFAPRDWGYSPLTFLACMIGVDFCYYWRHRWEHEINILWAEHSVHHSSEEYNFSTSLRLPWITPLFGWIFFAPLALAGFPAPLILACFFVNLLYQYWVHNDTIGKLPKLDRFLSTPSNHRVHHAANPEYLDQNYGGILILWDKLFGTYAPEGRRPRFGLVDPIGTRNPWLVNYRPFVRVYEKWKAARGFRQGFTALFGAPGAALAPTSPSPRQTAPRSSRLPKRPRTPKRRA